MSKEKTIGQILVKAGPVVVAVGGGSIIAMSASTVIVAIAAGVAVTGVGLGLYNWFSNKVLPEFPGEIYQDRAG